MIYTGGSVTGIGLVGKSVKQSGRTVLKDSGAFKVTTSILTMGVEAVIRAMQWLASQSDSQITRAFIFTDSVNLLQKVKYGMGCPDWPAKQSSAALISVDRLLWP